jgi:hypothetical protein
MSVTRVKPAKKPLRKRVKQVVSRLFYSHALARGCMKAEGVFHGNEVRGLCVFRENQLTCSGFIGGRKALLGASSRLPYSTQRSNALS